MHTILLQECIENDFVIGIDRKWLYYTNAVQTFFYKNSLQMFFNRNALEMIKCKGWIENEELSEMTLIYECKTNVLL